MSTEQLALDLALSTNVDETQDHVERRQQVGRAAVQEVDTHGWEAMVTDRGLCLSHAGRSVTLALPPNFVAYLAES